MKFLSRIIFGDFFKYENTFESNANDVTKRLSKLFTMKGVKGTIINSNINLTWNERSKKLVFFGSLTEKDGKTILNGEFALGAANTIRYLIWFSFWTIGYISWELGKSEFYKEGDDIVGLTFIILGLIMFIIFLIRTNKKVREISQTIDGL